MIGIDTENAIPCSGKTGEGINNILEKIGFIEVEDNPQTLGVASIYCATKP